MNRRNEKNGRIREIKKNNREIKKMKKWEI